MYTCTLFFLPSFLPSFLPYLFILSSLHLLVLSPPYSRLPPPMQSLSGDAMSKAMSPLLCHLCFGNMVFTNLFLGAIEQQFINVDHDQLKQVFGAIDLILAIDDDLADARLAGSLAVITGSLKSQSEFFHFTRKGLELLVRLAKKNPKVAAWWRAEGDTWMRQWLGDNTGISIGEHPTAARLSKPKVVVGSPPPPPAYNHYYDPPGVQVTSQIIAHDINCIVEGKDVDPGYVYVSYL